MPEQKPPTLVMDAAGGIFGMFHSGCADKIVRGGELSWGSVKSRVHLYGQRTRAAHPPFRAFPTVAPW